MRRLNILLAISVIAFLWAWSRAAIADEEGETSQGYASMAVQNRMYTQTGELSAFVGFLPMDAFTKGLTLGGGYTHHFSDQWAWEVAQYFYSFHIYTSLRDDLKAQDVEPTPFEVVNQMVTSNAVFKPVYWKGSVSNQSLIQGEFLLVAGAGYAWFTRSRRMLVDLGLGVRVYASRLISFRLDVRHHTFFKDTIFKHLKLDHELWMGLGTSFSF